MGPPHGEVRSGASGRFWVCTILVLVLGCAALVTLVSVWGFTQSTTELSSAPGAAAAQPVQAQPIISTPHAPPGPLPPQPSSASATGASQDESNGDTAVVVNEQSSSGGSSISHTSSGSASSNDSSSHTSSGSDSNTPVATTTTPSSATATATTPPSTNPNECTVNALAPGVDPAVAARITEEDRSWYNSIKDSIAERLPEDEAMIADDPRRIALVTSGKLDLCNAPLSMLYGSFRQYAKRHKYSRESVHEAFVAREEAEDNMIWGKLDALADMTTAYSWQLWLDRDGIIMNHTISVPQMVHQAAALLGRDPQSIDIILSKPESDKGFTSINLGFILVRGTSRARRILMAAASERNVKRFRKHPLEQGAMQLMYWMQEGQEAPPIVGVPSASLFNSMCGFPHGRCDWRPGFFNAHFAPSTCPEYIAMMEDMEACRTRPQGCTEAAAAMMPRFDVTGKLPSCKVNLVGYPEEAARRY